MKKFALISAMIVAFSAVGAWADCAETYSSDVLTIETVNGQCVATFDATSEKTLVVPKNFSVDKVVLERTINAQMHQTMVLPISFNSGVDAYTNGSCDVCTLSEITQDNYESNPWRVICDYIEPKKIEKNQPYGLKVNGQNKATFITNTAGGITIHATSSNDNLINAFAENWEFRGTYTYKKWGEGDSQIGHVYGFAANGKGENIKAGQFVRVAAGASIKPMRAYLYYNKSPSTSNAPAPANSNVLAKAAAEEELPESIEVIFRDKNGEVMSIAQMNIMTGEITAVEGWFDLKGRKLNQKPTQKGTYFNNGKKVVIK